jgi:ParB/RepB/Spo0J family partition protein
MRSVVGVTHEVRFRRGRDDEVGAVQNPHDIEREVDISELGCRLSALRLCEASALETMRRSLQRHGQLQPLTVFAKDGHFEVIDGFKRLRAAQALGLSTLRIRVTDVDSASAKVLMAILHGQCGLTELEEGWLVRSLYREDHLQQGVIAHRLGRHKSWVCRRLMLVEALDRTVQEDVRLGLLLPKAALAVGQLPRGNQQAAAQLVIQRGLTVRQTELWMAELMDCPNDAARAEQIAQWMEGRGPKACPGQRPSRAARNEADWICGDIRTLRLVAARLEARLSATPLCALGVEAAMLIQESLIALAPVLHPLQCTIAALSKTNDHHERNAA